MAYHIAVRIIHYDEIELLGIDSLNQFILYFVSAHLRFQVIRSNLRRRNKNTFFRIVRSFATAVEEECYVSILLRFGDMELSFTVGSQIFTQCILHVFLIEKDMYTLERSIVRSHTVVLQAGNSVHALFRHILLSQDDSQFLGTVVTIVEEDNHVTFLDSTVAAGIYNRLDEFIGYTFIVRLLHGLNHIRRNLSLTVYKQVVSHFHTFPTLVTVHGVETAYDGSNLTGRLFAMRRQLFDEALTALRVGIATVHEAMDKCILDTVFL